MDSSFVQPNLLHLKIKNVGDVNGVGYFGFDFTCILEVTDNSNNANDITNIYYPSSYLDYGGISKSTKFGVNNKIYYPVRRADLRNTNLIHNRENNVHDNTTYNYGLYTNEPNIDSSMYSIIYNTPALRVNHHIEFTLELNETYFKPNTTYIVVSDYLATSNLLFGSLVPIPVFPSIISPFVGEELVPE